MLLWWAICGSIFAVLSVVYAVITKECPYERVAFYLTILAGSVVTDVLAYVLLAHGAFIIISTFLLSWLICWSFMNHKHMVHYIFDFEE